MDSFRPFRASGALSVEGRKGNSLAEQLPIHALMILVIFNYRLRISRQFLLSELSVMLQRKMLPLEPNKHLLACRLIAIALGAWACCLIAPCLSFPLC